MPKTLSEAFEEELEVSFAESRSVCLVIRQIILGISKSNKSGILMQEGLKHQAKRPDPTLVDTTRKTLTAGKWDTINSIVLRRVQLTKD